MGRVRRYKKFKSCDPFAKAKPEVIDPKFDQPPSDIEDDFSADEEDFGTGKVRMKVKQPKKEDVQSYIVNHLDAEEKKNPKKIQKTPALSAVKNAVLEDLENNPKNLSKRSLKRLRAKAESGNFGLAQAQHEFQQELRDIKHVQSISATDTESTIAKKKIKLEGRKEGESMRKFVTRVKKDAQVIMKEARNDSSTTRKKKNEFLEQRKEKKVIDTKGKDFKREQREAQIPKDEYLPSVPKVAKGLIRVPEALMAPPIFNQSQLPRHCAPRSKLQKQQQTTAQLKAQSQQSKSQSKVSASAKHSSTAESFKKMANSGPTDDFGNGGGVLGGGSAKTASKEEMEKLRARIISDYKQFKEKKRA